MARSSRKRFYLNIFTSKWMSGYAGRKTLLKIIALARGNNVVWNDFAILVYDSSACRCFFNQRFRQIVQRYLWRLVGGAVRLYRIMDAQHRRLLRRMDDDSTNMTQLKQSLRRQRRRCERLERQLRQVHPSCVVCFNDDHLLACRPCGHVCLCAGCAPLLMHCPICRTEIQETIAIFF